jgi:AcrR family transcriptional regulator
MTSSLQQRVRAVPAPPPVLDREGEAALTDRQREILDELGTIFNKGFIELTMADLAAALNCSLRTLYGLAQSRNELVLMVLDRNLRKIGRAAHAAVDDDMSGLDAVRAYLSAGNTAVADVTPELGADMAVVAGGLEMWEAHEEYLISVTAALLDGDVPHGHRRAATRSGERAPRRGGDHFQLRTCFGVHSPLAESRPVRAVKGTLTLPGRYHVRPSRIAGG